jgi:hypothetical protein
MGIPECFEQVKGYKEIGCPRDDERPIKSVDPDVCLNRSPALGHTMGLGTFYVPIFI